MNQLTSSFKWYRLLATLKSYLNKYAINSSHTILYYLCIFLNYIFLNLYFIKFVQFFFFFFRISKSLLATKRWNNNYAINKHKSCMKNVQWNKITYHTPKSLNNKSVISIQKYLFLKYFWQQRIQNDLLCWEGNNFQ